MLSFFPVFVPPPPPPPLPPFGPIPHGLGVSSRPTAPPRPLTAKERRKNRIVWGAVMALLAAILVAGVLLLAIIVEHISPWFILFAIPGAVISFWIAYWTSNGDY